MSFSVSAHPDLSAIVRSLRLPENDSHKGQNGRLLIIGGSHLFHAASLWSLTVASRIVDLVHYASIKENNEIVQRLKAEFRNGIIVPRRSIEEYIHEDDCMLIGPGMMRADISRITNYELGIRNIADIEKIEDEGVQTYVLTKYLLQKYPHKQWVIDAGALQMMEPEWIPDGAILTPHIGEFERLKFKSPSFVPPSPESLRRPSKATVTDAPKPLWRWSLGKQNSKIEKQVQDLAKEHQCIVLLKGEVDYVASAQRVIAITGGNAGMTKGGTGDVLAGLVAALACTNDPFTAAVAGSYINKQAGDDLYNAMGYWFNASDLADQIPRTMKRLLS